MTKVSETDSELHLRRGAKISDRVYFWGIFYCMFVRLTLEGGMVLAFVCLFSFETWVVALSMACISVLIGSSYFCYDYDVFLRRNEIVCITTPLFGAIRRFVYTEPVSDARVQTETLRFFGDGHAVIIMLEDGFEVPLTPVCTMDPKKLVCNSAPFRSVLLQSIPRSLRSDLTRFMWRISISFRISHM